MSDHQKNIFPHAGELTREARLAALGAKGCTMWLTGLSGSGKSTIAAALESRLLERGVWAYRLDGDVLRTGLNSDLGFAAEDRAENIRRTGEVARLFADSGCIVLASLISPYTGDRQRVRDLHHASGLPYMEVFVDTPLAVCELRDPKGLYKKARAGQLRGFTGIDDPYQPPASPELHLHPDTQSIEDCVSACLDLLCARRVLRG